MELRGRKRQKVEPPEETARDFFPELLDGERLNRCKEECGTTRFQNCEVAYLIVFFVVLGACLFDISCEDGTASEDPAAEEVIGILDSCIHAFHASCIQVSSETSLSIHSGCRLLRNGQSWTVHVLSANQGSVTSGYTH